MPSEREAASTWGDRARRRIDEGESSERERMAMKEERQREGRNESRGKEVG